VVQDILEDYLGYVQSDGYSGYDHLSRNPDIIHMGCLAHVRRKFVEVNKGRKKARGKKKSSKGLADEALDYIGELYRFYPDRNGQGQRSGTLCLPSLSF
jgi:hypothetical protein